MLVKEFIFDNDVPFLQCHASTVLPLEDGKVLAAWFAGTKESHPDVKIYCAIRDNGKWSKPCCVTNDEEIAHWNPVLHQKLDGTIQLYYKIGLKPKCWSTRVIRSSDNGKAWSKHIDIPANNKTMSRGPVKNKCIRLSDGTIIAGASSEENGNWRAFCDLSYDDGETFTATKFIRRPLTTKGIVGTIQPTLWESKPDVVHMLLRTDKGYIYRSDSKDGGKTWCHAYKTALPNNNSGIDLVKTKDGTLYLCFNPVTDNFGKRTPLRLSFSHDNGKTWQTILDLESENGEFSYPAITERDDMLYITYTHNRTKIAFAMLDI